MTCKWDRRPKGPVYHPIGSSVNPRNVFDVVGKTQLRTPFIESSSTRLLSIALFSYSWRLKLISNFSLDVLSNHIKFERKYHSKDLCTIFAVMMCQSPKLDRSLISKQLSATNWLLISCRWFKKYYVGLLTASTMHQMQQMRFQAPTTVWLLSGMLRLVVLQKFTDVS